MMDSRRRHLARAWEAYQATRSAAFLSIRGVFLFPLLDQSLSEI